MDQVHLLHLLILNIKLEQLQEPPLKLRETLTHIFGKIILSFWCKIRQLTQLAPLGEQGKEVLFSFLNSKLLLQN